MLRAHKLFPITPYIRMGVEALPCSCSHWPRSASACLEQLRGDGGANANAAQVVDAAQALNEIATGAFTLGVSR